MYVCMYIYITVQIDRQIEGCKFGSMSLQGLEDGLGPQVQA